jgi:hypothetical protein
MYEQISLFILDPKTLQQARNLNNLASLEVLNPVIIISVGYGSSRTLINSSTYFYSRGLG